MKSHLWLFSAWLWLVLATPCLAQTPYRVGGFELGADISAYADKVDMQTALPIRYHEYLTEVEIKPVKGLKNGLICYGSCENPGRIVRIRLKYEDSSRKFYDELLKHYTQRFGKPDEWRGDAFHVVIAWKWSFVDQNNNQISLVLQHNIMDEEEKIGNAVKMTMTNLIVKEHLCFERKSTSAPPSDSKPATPKKGRSVIDWDLLIPR